MFIEPKARAVFEAYQARAQREEKQIAADGFTIDERDNFLLPIGEDVGRFLHSLILSKRPQQILEIGTSYGYSTLFLADAAKAIGARVITLELVEAKQDYARQKLSQAGLESHVTFLTGDAIALIKAHDAPIDFALLDIWKSLYTPCFDALYPKLSEEGIIIADNMYYPEDTLDKARAYRQAVLAKPNLQTVLLPIGSGIEVTCHWPKESPKI